MPERLVRVRPPVRELEVSYMDLERREHEEVSAVLEPLLWIVPPWCSVLVVRVQTLNGNTCEIGVLTDYRMARLTIDHSWFNSGIADKRHALAHELAHVLVGPMQQMGKSLIDSVHGAGPAVQLLRDRWSEAYENVVEDLARVLTGRGSRPRGGGRR